jgi:translation elongation factor EF-Tu-like GTPase
MSGNDIATKRKIPVTLGVFGKVDSGKSTTSSVIEYLFGKGSIIEHTKEDPFMNFRPAGGSIETFLGKLDKSEEEKRRGVTIEVTTVPLVVPVKNSEGVVNGKGIISLGDCPGHLEYQKNAINGAKGANGAIVMCTIDEGITPHTRSQIQVAAFARGAGLHLSPEENGELLKDFKVVVIINKLDIFEGRADKNIPEEIDLIEMEFNEIAAKYGIVEENITFIATAAVDMLNGIISGQAASMARVRDFYFPMRDFLHDVVMIQDRNTALIAAQGGRDLNSYVYLEGCLNIDGIGFICTGKVRDGEIKMNDKLYVSGPGIKESESGPYVVVGLQAFHEDYEAVSDNWNVGIKLRGLPQRLTDKKNGLLRKGCVLSKKPIPVVRTFEAKAIFSDEGDLEKLKQDSNAFSRGVKRRVGFEPNANDGYTSMPIKIVSFTHNGKTEVFDSKTSKNAEIPLAVPIMITCVILGPNKLPIMNGSPMIFREACMNVGQCTVVATSQEIHSSLDAKKVGAV